ncbi:MAG: efflux RND transporter periplasmic adaptor subunit [Deltaproteobacteria bacterium]|nr:efflux RND transporter periplasmic adaptor subunit [Deltaproteobacteria bacterium]
MSDESPQETEKLDEHPGPSPRSLRVMGWVRWAILLAVTAVAAFSVWRYWGPGSAALPAHREDLYYCPMHPQIRSPDPGECPICHMTLEPIPVERMQPVAPTSTMGSPDAGSDGGAAPDAVAALSPPPGVVPVVLSLERQQLIGMTTALVVRRTLGQQLRVPGVVEAPENAAAQVHVRTPGFLERVEVRQSGVRVARGQTLAWIYAPEIYQAQQELLTARRWAGAPAEAGLMESGPNDVLQAARRRLQFLGLADGDIDEVLRRGAAMRAVPIRAPIGGYVTRYAAVLGQYATPEMALYELSDLSRVWIVASLYERDLARISRGSAAQFVAAGESAPPVAARVDLIEPSVRSETRTARVRLSVPNPAMRLRPGQYGDVTFALPGASSLVVPRDAVADTGVAQYAFVDAGGGRFEPRRVRTGVLLGDDLEVIDGLREGERVVARGSFMVDSESRLQAALAESPSASDAGAVTP